MNIIYAIQAITFTVCLVVLVGYFIWVDVRKRRGR